MSVNYWNEKEQSRALEMRASGMTLPAVAEALGRTTKSVRSRLAYLRMTPEQRAKRQEYERIRNANKRPVMAKKAGMSFVINKETPPPEVLEERELRNKAPARNIASMVFGDPPVGYSALDRRRQVTGVQSLLDYFKVPESEQNRV